MNNLNILNEFLNYFQTPIESIANIANNGKTSIFQVKTSRRCYAIKQLTTDQPLYVNNLKNEINIYKNFNLNQTGFKIAKLYHYANDYKTCLLDFIEGNALSNDRYPNFTEFDKNITKWRNLYKITDTIKKYKNYEIETPAKVLEKYDQRLRKYIERGILEQTDLRLLKQLKEITSWEPEFNHGDLIPTNIICTENEELYLIDWEYAGSYLPCYDMVLLWAVSINHSEFHNTLENNILSESNLTRLFFGINALLVTAREFWIHQELDSKSEKNSLSLKLTKENLTKARILANPL